MPSIQNTENLLQSWKSMAERAGQPFVWAHIIQASLVSAISLGSERGPILRAMIGKVDEIIQQVGRSSGEPGLDRAALSLIASGLASFQQAQPPAREMALPDQILRWAASNLAEPGDWTLSRIVPLFRQFGLRSSHFDGRDPWPAAVPKAEEADEPIPWQKRLAQLVGLAGVKEEVARLKSFLVVLKQRKTREMPTSPLPLHQVFLGNPGTGKTTIARVLADIYREFGFLERGHLVETDRSGLVGSVIGETELKTMDKINQALGGVLFIDEAYSLATQSQQDFGQRAIDTLVKAMEDNRDRLVVIVAGYESEMQRFLDANPGLYGRFNRHLEFVDYSDDEMLEIFQRLAATEKYSIEASTPERISVALSDRRARLGRRFANARDVRTLWEITLQRQASRLCEGHATPEETEAALNKLNSADLLRIIPADVPEKF